MGIRWAWLVVAATGCYQPRIPTGASCATDTDCPAGQPCVENVCGGTASPPDPPPADATLTDTPIDPDAPKPPPVTVLLGDTPDELVDTEIIEFGRDLLGSNDHISVDTNDYSLIRFDLSQISSGTVLSAQLIVRTFDEASEDGGTVLVHRMRERWSEATASFEKRMGNTDWTGGPGAEPPSRDPDPIAMFSPAALANDYTVDLPVDVVQDWIDDPAINFGIIIVRGTSTQHVHFRSRENGPGARLAVEIQPDS